ncbi:hypothetical protein [Chondrinema litorale]|uniref:hypothetical protein n=1 Tax=Chondrinema litorale TaxID=2994555 RepID=UPI0025431009|nr:hypothetical protein [Chondrinema litorale]UZR97180.1 hypothetical protein OQ292_25100 [Chondrinema litorale]
MKKILLIKLHLYAGLFTSFYLIAFGLSSIILNHKIDVEKSEVVKTWSTKVEVNPELDNVDLAESLRDELGIMGWVPRWNIQRDSIIFKCQLTHLAKTSDLTLDFKSGIVQVEEKPKGLIAVLNGLHFFNGNIPNVPFVLRTWAVYQWLTLLTLFAALGLGLWLWLKYSRKTWELYVFGSLFIFSCILMVLI